MEQKTLIENLPMLRGLGEGIGGFNVALFVNGRRRKDLPSATKKEEPYVIDLYLRRKLKEGKKEYVEQVSLKESKKIKEVRAEEYAYEPSIEQLSYWWETKEEGEVLEEGYVSLRKGSITLESNGEAGRIRAMLRESGEELPTVFNLHYGTLPVSREFYGQLLKTVTGGLSIGEFFEKAKNSETLEDFIRITKQGSDKAIRMLVDYVKEHDDVEWMEALKTFGSFYVLCSERKAEPTLTSENGLRISFNPDKGIIFEFGSDKEVFSSWLINEDGVRYLGGKGERLYRIENFLIKHHEGFLKDLVEYLEKNYGKERREEQDIGIDMTM